MTQEHEEWLNERLGKPVVWSKHAASTAISRDIYGEDIKNAILFGTKIKCLTTKTGDKITVKKELQDPYYNALIVVYLDLPTHYHIVSNHYQKRKRRSKRDR